MDFKDWLSWQESVTGTQSVLKAGMVRPARPARAVSVLPNVIPPVSPLKNNPAPRPSRPGTTFGGKKLL